MAEFESCMNCKHLTKKETDFPCNECKHGVNVKDYYKPRSNADRIRSMSDEELAEYLTFNGFCNASPLCPHRTDDIQCEQCVIEWLKSEVKECEDE